MQMFSQNFNRFGESGRSNTVEQLGGINTKILPVQVTGIDVDPKRFPLRGQEASRGVFCVRSLKRMIDVGLARNRPSRVVGHDSVHGVMRTRGRDEKDARARDQKMAELCHGREYCSGIWRSITFSTLYIWKQIGDGDEIKNVLIYPYHFFNGKRARPRQHSKISPVGTCRAYSKQKHSSSSSIFLINTVEVV